MAPTAPSHKGRCEEISALYPYDPATKARNGRHPGKTFNEDGTSEAYDGMHMWFQAERVSFTGPRDLYHSLAKLADAGQAFVVRATPAHNGEYIRRSKVSKGSSPAGLAPVANSALPLDCDNWPNWWGIDPRKFGIDGLSASVMQAMPAEIKAATSSVFLSSSCCVGTPEGAAPGHLSFRVWLCMDRAMDEGEAKALVARIDAHVRAWFVSNGEQVDAGGFLVDNKVLETQQPIYLASPRFKGGRDPIVRRHYLREKSVELVDVASMEAHLPEATRLVRARTTKETETPAREPRPATTNRPRTSRSATEPRAPQVVPLAAARRLRDAKAEAARVDLDACTRVQASVRLFYARAPLEVVDLVLDCRRLAAAGDADYAGWEDGIPAGRRSSLLTAMASCIAVSMPLTATAEAVRAEILSWARIVVDEAWLATEWQDAAVIGNFVAAQDGEERVIGGVMRDARYWFSRRRLANEFSPTEDQVVRLGLRSLATEAQRFASQRAAKGAAPREEYLAKAHAEATTMAAQVQALASAGTSQRAIAQQLYLSKGQVSRLLKVEVAAVPEAVPATPEQETEDMSKYTPEEQLAARIALDPLYREPAPFSKTEMVRVVDLAPIAVPDDEFSVPWEHVAEMVRYERRAA